MKFSEIPQLISGGAWEANYSLSSVPKVLDEWAEESGLVLNPDFQRGHVWTEVQQTNYMEYFLRGGRSGMVIYFNQPSWKCGQVTDGYDDFVCVDGLQRLTAIVRFMKNEIRAFNQFHDEFGESIRCAPNSSGLRFNVNSLQTKEQVLTWYLQMNDGGTPHTVEEIGRVRLLLDAERGKGRALGPAKQTLLLPEHKPKRLGVHKAEK